MCTTLHITILIELVYVYLFVTAGFGLPLSRVFARYWGGDLQIVSVNGYGTDAHLHLNKLGNSNLFVD